MIDIANHRFTDVAGRAREAYNDYNALMTDRARMQAGSALSGGDYRGAANALYGSGDVTTGLRVTESGQQAAKLKREQEEAFWKTTGDIAGRLMNVYRNNPTAVVEQFDALAPRLQQLGEAPDEIAQTRQRLLADPETTLMALGAAAQSKDEGYTLGPGMKRFDKDNKLVAEAPFAPFAPEVVKYQNGRKEQIAVVDRNAGQPGAPRNQRNNNPGNIKDGPFAQSLPGYAGSDNVFAIFETPEAGRNAQQQLLASYGQRGFNTVKSIIERWAPPSDNNPTQAYIDFVARKLGVSPREALDMQNPQVVAALADAITQFEGGPQSASGGARIVASGAPKPKEEVRPATAEEKAAYGIGADVPARRMPNGSVEVVTGMGARQRPIPAKVQEGYVGNRTSLRQIQEAIAAIRANPRALGWGNYAPEAITQRLDAGGVKTRAPVANIGSLIIHDRSGAAVTAAETPRLKPFVPQVTDTPDAAIAKLEALAREIENRNSEIEVTYGEESGYAPLGGQAAASGGAKRLRFDAQGNIIR